jgi:hypothetical protein
MAERSVKAWSIEVPVSAEVAFAYLADVNRHAEWSPKPYWIDPPPELPLVVGSTFTSHGHIPGDKNHTNEVESSNSILPTRSYWRVPREETGTCIASTS